MNRRRPVVLYSHGPLKDTDNPYLHQLVAGIREHAEVRFLHPLTALTGRVDVLHVHWPHQLVRGSTRWRTLVKAVTSWVLLARVRRRRVPVVLTVHNLGSHEAAGRVERALVRRLERLVSLRIHLNESADDDLSGGVVVLHGSYREWLVAAGALPREAAHRPGALTFGLLRPYKGIEALVATAHAAGVPLLVAGQPVDPAYAAELHRLAAAASGVEVREGHLSDHELVRLVLSRDLVVLPYPRMYNSGALLYALSVGRAVLAPRSPANEALAAEVGPEWLRLYDPPLSPAVLQEAVAGAATLRTAQPPDLSRRAWPVAVDLHRRVYAGVVASPGRLRTRDPAADQRRNRAALVQDEAFAAHSPRNRP